MRKNITLEADGLKITGQLYLPCGQSKYPAVCVCHGIPARSPDPTSNGYPILAEKICQEGFAVLIFNFRGTGTSEGNFDISGWTKDLESAINYLWELPEVDKSRLSLLSFSGGAAVSIYVASMDKRVSSVASCACPAEFVFLTRGDNPQAIIDRFRNIGIIRDNDFPASTKAWLNGFKLVNPIEHISGIAPRPLLLVHGSDDETVAISHARRLYAKAKEPRQLVIIGGGRHRLRQNDEAMSVAINWLKLQGQIS